MRVAVVAVFLLPALLFWSLYRIVIADDAACVKVCGNFFYDVQEFQVLGKVGRNCTAAKKTANDVATDGTGGVAVAGVVYAAYDCVFKRIAVLYCTIDRNGKSLVAGPAAADGLNGCVVQSVSSGKVYGLLDYVLLGCYMIRPEFFVGLVIVWSRLY